MGGCGGGRGSSGYGGGGGGRGFSGNRGLVILYNVTQTSLTSPICMTRCVIVGSYYWLSELLQGGREGRGGETVAD